MTFNPVGMNSIERTTVIYALLVALMILVLLSCDKGNLPPTAVLKVYPSIGDTTLVFEFNAGESDDDRSYALALQYRWDFDGDGIWDTEYSKYSATNFRFKQPGDYTVAVEVKDLDGLSAIARDSIIVFGENQDIDTLHDSRDGNEYRIVKIGDQWWMAENLRYGMVIPTDREQTDNGIVEMYRTSPYQNYDTVGGIYSWLETKNYKVNDPKGICPDGWHLPTRQEWEGLLAPYPKRYSLQYFGKEGLSNLNLDLNNGGIRTKGTFQQRYMGGGYSWDTGFWSSSYTLNEQEYLPYFCSFSSDANNLTYGYWHDGGLTRYYSVRCVRNN